MRVADAFTTCLVEEECPARGTGEACGDELRSVCQDGVTVSTGEETRPTNVIQKDAAHGSSKHTCDWLTIHTHYSLQ